MLITSEQVDELVSTLSDMSGLDAELVLRCGFLIRTERYDEAVGRAFVVLEERLRTLLGVHEGTGGKLVQKLFSAEKTELTDRLFLPENELRGLREIYLGSFAAFRNRAAHTVAGYTLDEARGIIQLVSLLLLILDQIREAPEIRDLPEIAHLLDPAAQERLQRFLGKAHEIGITQGRGKAWTPYQATLNYHPAEWDEAKPHRVSVFYIGMVDDKPVMAFNTPYLSKVSGLDAEKLEADLLNAECVRVSAGLRPIRLHLIECNDQPTFDRLFEILRDLVQEHRAF